MRLVIADDEPLARERLRSLLAELDGDYRVVGEAASGAEVLRIVRETAAEVVLLDIRMPGMDGLEAAARLAELEAPPAVLFTTAYERYALDAFEYHAVGYLLKPIRADRLREALQKTVVLNRAQLVALGESTAAPSSVGRGYVRALYRGGIQQVPVTEVLYFRAEQKYVRARTEKRDLLLDEALKSLEQEFAALFLRIHRNALISRARLRSLEKGPGGLYRVRLAGCDECLEVSRRHLPALRRWLRDSGDS